MKTLKLWFWPVVIVVTLFLVIGSVNSYFLNQCLKDGHSVEFCLRTL